MALDQIAVSDRNFDRFALLLIDNVVELTLHKFAEDMDQENKVYRYYKESPQFDEQAVERALNNDFKAKVALASSLGLLSEASAQSLRTLHAFRNTAYHRGVRHEGILHSLAIFYAKNACMLLREYKPRVQSHGSDDSVSHRARKYIGSSRELFSASPLESAYVRLSEVADAFEKRMIEDLASDMEATIDDFDGTLEFWVENNPNAHSRDEEIISVQAWHLAFSEEGRKFASSRDYAAKNHFELVQWFIETFPWKVKSDPVVAWRKRLESLREEVDEHTALRKYDAFMRQTAALRGIFAEAARRLDDDIQLQIDIMRGK
ncbi:MAG TPA: hypothetical protein VFO29_01570 [Candidatus Rubrimentiphilum sp.]|nr:hypothetical protein [Candidatus Rubrimentiphilum sp.]